MVFVRVGWKNDLAVKSYLTYGLYSWEKCFCRIACAWWLKNDLAVNSILGPLFLREVLQQGY